MLLKKLGPEGNFAKFLVKPQNEQLYKESFAALGSPHIVPIGLRARLLPHHHLRPLPARQSRTQIKCGAHRHCNSIQQGLLLSCIEVFFVPTGRAAFGEPGILNCFKSEPILTCSRYAFWGGPSWVACAKKRVADL